MKTFAVFCISLFALTIACGGGSSGNNPGDAVTEMFDALREGNGESAVSYMSESALEEMEEQLEYMKMDPESSAQQLTAMGIEIDAAAIPDMTAKDFAVVMISSPMMQSNMESSEIIIGDVNIEGDMAKVEVNTTFMNKTETHTIDVNMEDGQWRVTEFGMNM